jgi:hypothetical protein
MRGAPSKPPSALLLSRHACQLLTLVFDRLSFNDTVEPLDLLRNILNRDLQRDILNCDLQRDNSIREFQ